MPLKVWNEKVRVWPDPSTETLSLPSSLTAETFTKVPSVVTAPVYVCWVPAGSVVRRLKPTGRVCQQVQAGRAAGGERGGLTNNAVLPGEGGGDDEEGEPEGGGKRGKCAFHDATPLVCA